MVTTGFNILDHLNNLELVKESSTDYQCLCPVCGDGGFKIDKRSGKYSTFKCGCMDTPAGKKAVINAIAPRDNNQKAPRPKQIRTWIYRDRQGNPLVRVGREDFGDGRTPKRWQEHWVSTPNLKAGTEAIQSRWAVLEFNKTYKDGADPAKGEIEADSRFRYDPDFLKEKVCPALLNKMLEAIATLAIEGIDYSCTSEALSNIQQETNHLWAFARDVGLDYQTDGRVYINDLWERLQAWYIDNGTLEIITSESGKEKKNWHDQPRRDDKNVKAPNQVYQRFAELFPKIKRLKETEEQERRGQSYLAGISFEAQGTRQLTSQLRASYEPINEPITLTQQAYEPNEAKLATLTEISQTLEQLDPESLEALSFMLSGQTKQVLSQDSEGQIGSFASYPCPDGDTASLTGSLLPRNEKSFQQSDSLEESAPEDTRSAPHQDSSEPEEEPKPSQTWGVVAPQSEPQIDWVRYRGEPWTVARQDEKGLLWLRKSGFQKVIHTVHVSQVEIGGYKQ